jgi:hypothetical protein
LVVVVVVVVVVLVSVSCPVYVSVLVLRSLYVCQFLFPKDLYLVYLLQLFTALFDI